MSEAFLPTTIEVSDNGISEFEEVLPNLRWRNGVLQQAYRTRTYQYGTPLKEYIDWRPVPTEDQS